MIEPYSAPTRKQVSDWSSLTQKKFRREHSEFLIEGDVCVREALRARVSLEAVLVLASEVEKWQEEFGSRPRFPVFTVNSETFGRISTVESSQGIVAVARVFQLPPRAGKLAILCEKVSDPGNCGALVRVADFFGAIELLLGPESAEVWNPKVVRGSMGSLFHQPVQTDVDIAAFLREWPGSSVATVAHSGEPLHGKLNLKPPVVLVLGHETRGLSDDVAALCTDRITLAPQGSAESLNLVTAAAVFAYALS
ncbi:MAG TPA: RNA methyltransferase [bacterium]|jgi:TrmH family RNA methyltransferase